METIIIKGCVLASATFELGINHLRKDFVEVFQSKRLVGSVRYRANEKGQNEIALIDEEGTITHLDISYLWS